MAPPAKRRKRNAAVEESDDEEDVPRSTNTLANFLFSSPRSATDSRPPSASPSPIKPRKAAPRSPTKGTARQPRKGSQSNGNGTSNGNSNGSPKKNDSNGKTADLRSLFSKQEKRAPKAEKRPSPTFDDIVSDPISEDDEISERKASSSSLVGQHARKRLNSGMHVTDEAPKASQFLKPPRPVRHDTLDDDARPWSERFGPRNLEELAVHKKKVADVRAWLEGVMVGKLRHRLLVLKGPAGSGKTTTMRLLAEVMGCELLEWKNPTGNIGTGFVSTSAEFDDFLGRGGKFGGLELDTPTPPVQNSSNQPDGSNPRRIIMIEEFPNTFSRSSSALSSFRSSIMQYLQSQTPSRLNLGRQNAFEPIKPVVMIISETLLTTTSASADSFTAHRLLGPEILQHVGTSLLEFNAIAPTILMKAIELVVVKEARKSGRRRTPGPQVLKRLGEIGDIRSAISSLEFLCLKGDQDADWGAKVTFSKPKASVKNGISLTKGEVETLEMVSQREASLGIFHAVGKVVYNKRDETAPCGDEEKLPSYLSHTSRPKKSEVSVDALIDETGTDTHTFISALHENYVPSCESSGPMDLATPMDYVGDCVEYLSQSDLLCPSRDIFFGGRGSFGGRDSGGHILRQDEITFEVAVRGLLYSLPYPVKRKATGMAKGADAFKMFYPQSLKLWRAREEIEGLVDMWSAKLLKGESDQATKSLTEGASAFRIPKSQSSDSSSWMTRQSQLSPTKRKPSQDGASNGTTPTEAAPPLLSLGSAARRELLLERLPYMAHIASGRKGGPVRQRDLEKMTSFSGLKTRNDDEDDEDGDDDNASGEAWATDKPSEEQSPRKKRTGVKAGAMSGMLAQKLVLSDDDIED